MNKYTVDIVKENPITGIVNVCALRRHGGMWIDLPVGVKNGDHIWALCDHRGVEIVYVTRISNSWHRPCLICKFVLSSDSSQISQMAVWNVCVTSSY